jgi:murein tripeptide amidase MpaA
VIHIIPVVNPDGLALIEKDYARTGKVLKKRKNQNPSAMVSPEKGQCAPEDSGVDLNRNYGMDWGVVEGADKEDSIDPCGESFKGASAFSEKETQAMKEFIENKKDNLKFVINLHSNGNSYIWPYNGRSDNDIISRNPGKLEIFQEIA